MTTKIATWLAALAVIAVLAIPGRVAAQQLRHATAAPKLTTGAQIDAYLTQAGFHGYVYLERHGQVILSKGYGMADRERKVPNTPSTLYPLGGVSFSYSILGTLWLEEHGKLPDQAHICTYIPDCPDAWQPITVHMVLGGTSQIPNYDWGQPGHTTAQSVRALEAKPLDGTPGASIDYQNGDVLVLATIIEKVNGESWAAFLQRTIFGPAGMTHSGRVTHALVPPARAQDYSGDTPDDNAVFDDYFQAYGTAQDVYAYDNALFGGRLVSRATLARLFGPGVATGDLHSGFTWQTGRVAGHRAVYTSKGTKSFSATNMRFPRDGVTIVVISNDDTNLVRSIAAHLATAVFG
jgi:CubicO group peptidase (beta-lactamase class C family)